MIQSKVCCTCKKEKILEDFTKNKNLPDGRARVCKKCRKEYYRHIYSTEEGRRKILENIAKYKAKPGVMEKCKERIERWRHSEKGYPKNLATIRRYQKTERGRAVNKESTEKYRNSHRDRDRINKVLQKAVYRGKISKSSVCSSCGKTNCKIDGHHYRGYAWENRYNVIWLCAVCHKKAETKKENECLVK
jgi:hypothetical protein